jgi:hypothetical protein
VHDLVLVALIHSMEDTDRMIEVVTDAVTSQRWIGYSGLGSGHRGVNVLKLQGKLMQAQAVRQAKQAKHASTQAHMQCCWHSVAHSLAQAALVILVECTVQHDLEKPLQARHQGQQHRSARQQQ